MFFSQKITTGDTCNQKKSYPLKREIHGEKAEQIGVRKPCTFLMQLLLLQIPVTMAGSRHLCLAPQLNWISFKAHQAIQYNFIITGSSGQQPV